MTYEELAEQINLEPLFTEMGLDELPDDRKAVLQEKVLQAYIQNLMIRLSSYVTDEDNISEDASFDEFTDYLTNVKGIDIQEAIVEEAVSLRDMLTESMSYLKGYMDAQNEKGE